MSRNLANTRVRGRVYHFRRRVPPALTDMVGQAEIVRSLRTSSAREARRRAAILWTETDRAFELMSKQSLAAEQVAAIIRRLREEPLWESPTVDELLDGVRQGDMDMVSRLLSLGRDETLSLPPEERQHVLLHLQRLIDQTQAIVADARAEAHELQAEVAERREVLARYEAMEAELSLNMERGAVQALEWRLQRVNGMVDGLVAAIDAQSAAAGSAVAVVKPSPLFSALIEEFITHKKTPDDDGRAYSNQTEMQVRATFRLWVEIVGDKPVREYPREEVGRFRQLLLQLPSSHSKSTKSETQLTAMEAIERNKSASKPTLTLKTAKRHFSALMQYWKWLKTRGQVDDVIFSGFEFPGTKSNKKRRDDWSPEDLGRLFAYEEWFGPGADRDSAYFWLPIIALHSGMRVEEIARLRPAEDIRYMDGVPAIVIQPHPDGWNPKTEAGERVVPIHSRLVQLGFLDFVHRRRNLPYLFSDLHPGGPDGKRSYTFSREFSRAKKHKIGVGAKTTFHSFRHSVRTLLTDVDAELLRDAWIDAVMGHDADDGRGDGRRPSEGIKTYLKRVGLKRMEQVVEAIVPPVDLSHLLRG